MHVHPRRKATKPVPICARPVLAKQAMAERAPGDMACINKSCPVTGNPVASYTHYRGRTVGFANEQLRDEFATAVRVLDASLDAKDEPMSVCVVWDGEDELTVRALAPLALHDRVREVFLAQDELSDERRGRAMLAKVFVQRDAVRRRECGGCDG